MIPKQLTLKNFLSYREATLDFRGLHVACIAGANGAGKSSLLEAITWAIWGQSRVLLEDDVIHGGEMEAQVDFIFEHHRQTYRILRNRRRNQGTTLEFQVLTEAGFRALTQRGMRATQSLVCQHLKLDYETFVNSAYLRQGRADEFMLKRPSERKQILADLLKLGQYDQLAERAKDRVKEAKAQITVIQSQLDTLAVALQPRSTLVQDIQALEAELAQLEQAELAQKHRIDQIQGAIQQRQIWQQQLALHQQQRQHLQQALEHLQGEKADLEVRSHQINQILEQAETITAGYRSLQCLQAENDRQIAQMQRYQQLQTERQQIEQQYQEHYRHLEDALRQAQLQHLTLAEQRQECQPILARAEEVGAALAQLRTAKARLKQMDELHLQVTPLLQQRQTLQNQLMQAQTRLQARLEEVAAAEQQLQQQQTQQPRLHQAVMEVEQTLDYLEKRRLYQAKVREKGLERRSFMEQLQANQRTCEAQLAQIDQKIRLLAAPNAVCPLCDRPLDEHHWQLVLERQHVQQKELQDQLWVIREQLAASEREIQVLRQEYREVEAELERYPPTLQQQGSLEVQLHNSLASQSRLEQLEAERQQLEHCIQENQYALEIQTELSQVEHLLGQLPYDERDHALARGQVDRLRWAEIKQAEIEQARSRQARILAQQPQLTAQIADLETAIADLENAPLRQRLVALDQQLAEVNYQVEAHQRLQAQLQTHQSWQLRYQELEQARHQHPVLTRRLGDLHPVIAERTQALAQLDTQIDRLAEQLHQCADPQDALRALETDLKAQHQRRDRLFARLGALQQQRQHLEQLHTQCLTQQAALQTAQHQLRIYQELAQAFGRNGIQALMVENLLPQLEAETNHLLSRLSSHQLHVQFVTQRASRRQQKLIDTLDILIADARGTRPYETYSGGEAFRVNFAIRLALARLLAQRSGMALQMLIIDEGFGTQDQEGCDRLISAISAIAPDFACILAVTHIPHFREAFQTRIDVIKTESGSHISLSL